MCRSVIFLHVIDLLYFCEVNPRSRKPHRLDYCRLSTLVLIACPIIWPASVLFFFGKSFCTWVNSSIIGIPCLLYEKNIYMGRYTYYVELGWKEGGRDTTSPPANQNLAIPALPCPNCMPSPRYCWLVDAGVGSCWVGVTRVFPLRLLI